MKTVQRHRAEQGSVLVVTLFIASLFGMFLYSYLHIVRGQRALVARSQAWNASLGLAEAGAEEALAHLNPGAPRRKIVFASDGWLSSGSFYGPISRNLREGSYTVVFTHANFPRIYSTGYVDVPSIPAKLQRVIEVCTTNSPLFTAPMAARYNIDLLGNEVSTDSFDSMNPDWSTNGLYDPGRALTNGDVASIAGVVNVGNANVNGSVLLGPTASDTMSRNGVVTGDVRNDFNVEFEDVILPEDTSSWPTAAQASPPVAIDGVSYDYVFDGVGGNFCIDSLKGSIYVGTNTTVALLLTGDADVTRIRIAGRLAEAGNLTVYMLGSRYSMSGTSTIDTGNALNFSYYGAPSNTRIDFSGNASFTGTIYAPQADFSMGGGGSGVYDFVGASTTRSVQMNGHFRFHFDENLLRAGPKRPYVAASWREI